MDIFWKSHDPLRSSWSRQYRAVIFYHSGAQRVVAFETRDAIAHITKGEIATAIEPYSEFYIAEDYHQKHSLRIFPEIMKEFTARYPDMSSLLKSAAVTRVNGYLGGYGSCESLNGEIDAFGLSEDAKRQLTSIVCKSIPSTACKVC